MSKFILDGIAFLLPPLIACVIARKLPRRASVRLVGVRAVVAVALYVVLVLALPFWGLYGEIVIGTAAVAALVPTMLLCRADDGGWGNAPQWFAFLFLPMIVGVQMPWSCRVWYAECVAWECDGTIVSKYRSHNHLLPTLVVQTAGEAVTLEGVEESLWQQAGIGDHLVKSKGSAFGSLQGRAIRIVPPNLQWWCEPGRT